MRLNIIGAEEQLLDPRSYPFYRIIRESAQHPLFRVFEMKDRDAAMDRFDMEAASCADGQVCRVEHHLTSSHCSLIISVGETDV